MNKEIEEFPPGIHSRKEYKIKMEWKIKSNCLNFQTAKRFMKNSFLNCSNEEMDNNRFCITYHVCIEKTDLQCISSKKLTGLLGKAV